MVLKEYYHCKEVEELAHKRIFNLTQGIVDFTGTQPHLKGKKLTGSRKSSKNNLNVETKNDSDHAFTYKKKYVLKVEGAVGTNIRTVVCINRT